MKTINARNINDAAAKGITYLLENGVKESSRNGDVIVAPGPVCTVYTSPLQRVLFSPLRDANPFFHLMESLWMLAGRNDLSWPVQFNKRFKEYSDNGMTIHGAYGYRWSQWFGFDQLNELVKELRRNPNSRRAVLAMWSPEGDLVPDAFDNGGLTSKDVPCNTHAYFDIRGKVLNMTVCNRSNDIIWGAYGANAVHFSFLQEYLAARIGVEVGVYRQFSNNFHAYTDIYDAEKLRDIAGDCISNNMYSTNPHFVHVPLVGTEDKNWEHMLQNFMAKPESNIPGNNFFSLVARPMYIAWIERKAGDDKTAYEYLKSMPLCDWRVNAMQWVERREMKDA